jgi:hypothetical protein
VRVQINHRRSVVKVPRTSEGLCETGAVPVALLTFSVDGA